MKILKRKNYGKLLKKKTKWTEKKKKQLKVLLHPVPMCPDGVLAKQDDFNWDVIFQYCQCLVCLNIIGSVEMAME